MTENAPSTRPSTSSTRRGGELDLDQKARLAGAFVASGMYVRLDLKVAIEGTQRSAARAMELTDIDVLGATFDSDLSPVICIGDCTTKPAVSPAARAFWLQGVMSLFGASRAFLVIGREPQPHERQHAEQFGISIVSESGLSRWVERLPDIGFRPQVFLADWLRLENAVSSLPPKLQQLATFRKYGFWQAEPNQSILQTIRVLAASAASLNHRDPFHRAVVLDAAGMLSLSLLRLAHATFYVSDAEFMSSARTYLFGGARALRLREQLLDRMRTAMPDGRGAGGIVLDPPYMSHLFELARRLAQRPLDARLVPQQFVAALYRVGLQATEMTVPQKLAWDILRFLVKASGLASEFSAEFRPLQPSAEQLEIAALADGPQHGASDDAS